MSRDRDRISPDGLTVIFEVDDFYRFCAALFDAWHGRESVVIEDIAEHYVEKLR